MKRAGFTMIELIFVIVILGILAAVAIPKLAATRDDAKIAAAATNAGQIFQDVASYYTARGDINTTSISDITNGTQGADWTTTHVADSVNFNIAFESPVGTECISIDINTSAVDSSVTVNTSQVAANASAVCTGVKKLVAAQTVKLGGSSVVW